MHTIQCMVLGCYILKLCMSLTNFLMKIQLPRVTEDSVLFSGMDPENKP